MMRSLLGRGMIAGVVAGILAAVFAYLVGEGPVDAAIGFESAMAGHGGHEDVELVSRGVQSTIGLSVAASAYGAAIGGLLALAFALSLGRIGSRTVPGPRSLVLAATGFAVVVLVPFLEYPANPPSVGRPDTIDERTTLYFGFTMISVLAFALALAIRSRLRQTLDAFNASVVAGGGYVVLVGLAARLMPRLDETPKGFPATLMWTFRLSSLGTQVVLWISLGLVFGLIAAPVVRVRTRAVDRARSFAG